MDCRRTSVRSTQALFALALSLSSMLLPGRVHAVGDGATKFNVFVQPNANNTARRSMLIVTATSASTTTLNIVDDSTDGDSDDTAMNISLARGESYIVRLADGATNDDFGGKVDGDYFRVSANHPVVVQMATASNWQHDWAASESKSGIGTSFFLYAPATSGADNDINIFAYSDDTLITVRDISTNTITSTGKATVNLSSTTTTVLSATLHEGEDLIVRQNNLGLDVLNPGRTYWVQASRPVTVQYGHLGQVTGGSQARDGGGFVPSANGTSAGSLYYFTIPHDPGLTNEKELRVVCFNDNTTVQLSGAKSDTASWTTIDTKTINAGQHLDYVGASNATFRGFDLYKLTVSPAYNVCTVFEANWLETGSYGTSDFASAVASSNGKNIGNRFVAYMGPPGLQSGVANPTGELTNNASPASGYASHLYIYATESGTTNVTVKDVDTNGTIVTRSFDIPAEGYYDFVVDRTAYDAMRASGRRPYLDVRSNKAISVMNGNFNDNWMAFFFSAIVAEPRASISTSSHELACNATSSVTVGCRNQTGPQLSSTSMVLTLPTGVVPVNSASIPGSPTFASGKLTWSLGTLDSSNPASFAFDVKYDCTALSCPVGALSALSVECAGTSGSQVYADVTSAQVSLRPATSTQIANFVVLDDPGYTSGTPRIRVSFDTLGGIPGTSRVVLKRATDNPESTATQTTLATFNLTSASQSLSFDDSYPMHYQQQRFYRLYITDGSCSSVVGPVIVATSSGSSGGEDSGLESNGRLAEKLARRAIMRSMGWASYTPEAISFVRDGIGVTHAALSDAHGARWLQDLFPMTGPVDSAPADVTPGDLPAVTNAQSVASADYMNTAGDRVASVLAVETVGETYEHGKGLCDRAHGSTLDKVEHVGFPEGDLIRIAVADDRAQTGEYAIDLKLYQLGDGEFRIESHWNRAEYTAPEADQHVINLQVWSAIPGYEIALLQQILDGMTTTWTKAGDLPALHFDRVATLGGQIEAKITANDGEDFEGGRIRMTRLLEDGRQETDTIKVDGADVTYDAGMFSDVTLELLDADDNVVDSVWVSDGAYAVIDDSLWGGGTKLDAQSFECDEPSRAEAGALVLSGCAHVVADVDEVAGVARHLGGAFAPLDVSDYDYIQAWVRSNVPLTVCAENKATPAAEQACAEISAKPQGALVAIPLASLKQREGCAAAELATVDTFSFTAHEKGRADIEVKSLSLVKGTASAPEAAPRCAGAAEELPDGLRCSVSRPAASSFNLALLALGLVATAAVTRRRARRAAK